jgi:hypothetical protein
MMLPWCRSGWRPKSCARTGLTKRVMCIHTASSCTSSSPGRSPGGTSNPCRHASLCPVCGVRCVFAHSCGVDPCGLRTRQQLWGHLIATQARRLCHVCASLSGVLVTQRAAKLVTVAEALHPACMPNLLHGHLPSVCAYLLGTTLVLAHSWLAAMRHCPVQASLWQESRPLRCGMLSCIRLSVTYKQVFCGGLRPFAATGQYACWVITDFAPTRQPQRQAISQRQGGAQCVSYRWLSRFVVQVIHRTGA